MNENNNTQQENISRVLLVGVNVDDNPDFETSMEELESLAEACEMEVAAKIEQNLSSLNPAYYIGSGKVKEVQETVEQMDLDYVIFDETLSPSQLKNLQSEINALVERISDGVRAENERLKERVRALESENAELTAALGEDGSRAAEFFGKKSGKNILN